MTVRAPRSHAYRGGGLEVTLDLAHDLYNKRGTARIRRYHLAGEFRKQARGGAVLVPLPKAEQPPDYHGCVAGQLVVFDAKQTDSPAGWRLDARYAHQYDRLRWWSEVLALAFFAVESVPLETLFLLRMVAASPWPDVTFPVGDAEHWPGGLVVRRNDEGWYDWLAAAQDADWLPPSFAVRS